MALSRLRLRLTGAFSLAFAAGLTVLTACSLGFLWYESVRRIDIRLQSIAAGAGRLLERERSERPDTSLWYAAAEAVGEWPLNEDSFVIFDEFGKVIVAADRVRAIDSAVMARARMEPEQPAVFHNGERDIRALLMPVATFTHDGQTWRYQVMSYLSMEGVERDVELLLTVLGLAAPLIIGLSLGAGYLLARRALTPMNDLRAAIAGVAPTDLDHRLPVKEPPDEVGALTAEVNALFGRLSDAQNQNRRFIRAAAHQIRTPLTLVLGEAEYELAADESTKERMRAALMRVRTAAEQMTHRVDELFLLAEAQAGEVVELADTVELDGLVLECTDLMRGRAFALGRTLAIGHATTVRVKGNATLLREAVLELIENGCRHGDRTVPITVSAEKRNDRAIIEVESAGRPFSLPVGPVSGSSGIGLPIVQWIVRSHQGDINIVHNNGRNRVVISLQI